MTNYARVLDLVVGRKLPMLLAGLVIATGVGLPQQGAAASWVGQVRDRTTVMMLSQNSRYEIQDFWMSNNQIQLGYRLNRDWSFNVKPMFMMMDKSTMAQMYQAGLVTGLGWAGPLRARDYVRYHVFSLGLGYQYEHSEGTEQGYKENKNVFVSELYGEYWVNTWLNLNLYYSLRVGKKTPEDSPAPGTGFVATGAKGKVSTLVSGDSLAPTYLFVGLQGQFDAEYEMKLSTFRREEYRAGVFSTFRANVGRTVYMLTVAFGYGSYSDNYTFEARQTETGFGGELELMVGFF